jgi:RNA polymerase sigma factor (sigma-70 family)
MYRPAPVSSPPLVRTSAPVRTTDGGDVSTGDPDPGTASEDDGFDVITDREPATSEPPWAVAARCFRAWKDGDRSALDELVRQVSPVLWQVVRSYGIDRASAEDVVQTTWMTLMRKSEQVRDDQAVLRWLTMTARREAWRVAQSRTRSNPTEDAVIEVSLPAARSPESEVVETDAMRRLWSHVHELDARCQHLLRVIAFQQRPDYAVLAAHLDMPMGSIGPTRSRCLAKLRTLIASDEGIRR